MNALETYKKQVEEILRRYDDGDFDQTEYEAEQGRGIDLAINEDGALAALEAAATKYADERVRAELQGLKRTNILAGLPAEATTVVLIEDIEARLSQLTAEGK